MTCLQQCALAIDYFIKSTQSKYAVTMHRSWSRPRRAHIRVVFNSSKLLKTTEEIEDSPSGSLI